MDTVETLDDLFIQFGAGWVMWLLFALSAGSVAVAIERFVFYRQKSDDLRGLVGVLDAHLRAGDRAGALEVLAPLRSVGAGVACAGLRLADRGPRAAEKGMESAMAIERKELEARLAYLGTLGNNAPFVGLFGTVIGVILAFEAMASGEVMGAIGCPWPREAEGLGIDEQVVLLRVVVGADGRASSADVLADPGHGFGQAALGCARVARFEPARDRAGQPYAATSPPIRVTFRR